MYGKSSFINTLCNRKNMARTSNTPGKTRQINFYSVVCSAENSSEKINFHIVDLPGYGYSKMSKQEKVDSGQFIEDYLSQRENIALIVMLVDIRHNPTEDDLLMYNYILSTNLPFMIVASKADKIAVTKVDEEVEKIKKFFGISYSTVIPFSSERKIYTDKAWQEIEKFLQN